MRASVRKKAKRLSKEGMSNRAISRTLGVMNVKVSAWNRNARRDVR
jgi:transposase-like protein